MPEWQDLLKERRVWMSKGGAKGSPCVSAGFHWDHMQNIHVVLSGEKEACDTPCASSYLLAQVFLVPPLLAPALHLASFPSLFVFVSLAT